MALSNAVQNARHTPQVITWQDNDGEPLNLYGGSLSGRVRDLATLTARNIDGTLTIIDGPAGVFQWAYGTLDVGTAGAFEVQFIATFGGGLADRTLNEPWRVIEAI